MTHRVMAPDLAGGINDGSGAEAAAPISGWERPQWCRKAASPGPRGDDAVAPIPEVPQITIGGLKSTL